jgi:hypothetical protein
MQGEELRAGFLPLLDDIGTSAVFQREMKRPFMFRRARASGAERLSRRFGVLKRIESNPLLLALGAAVCFAVCGRLRFCRRTVGLGSLLQFVFGLNPVLQIAPRDAAGFAIDFLRARRNFRVRR